MSRWFADLTSPLLLTTDCIAWLNLTMTNTNRVETMESAPLPRLSYKINEAAQILGVSPITIRRAISRGLLKPCRAFRHPLIPAEQLKKLITQGDDTLSSG